MRTFTQCDCGHIAKANGVGTGYGKDRQGRVLCYACCAKQTADSMKDGKPVTLYWDPNKDQVTDWSGHLRLNPARIRTQRTYVFGRKQTRTDVWLTYAGHTWHGWHAAQWHDPITLRVVKSS